MTTPVESQSNDLERRTLILEESIHLFATKGFEAVSMRDIAKAVGITPAALYHHFTNKKHLHFCAMQHAFHGRAQPAMDMLSPASGTPVERLRNFVHRLCERFHEDVEFRMLLQRERLEYKEEENQAMVASVFRGSITGLQELLSEIAPDFDKHLLANSVFGLVIHFYETESRRRHLPGYNPKHSEPAHISRHIMALLLNGILPRQEGAGKDK